jgi:hypothetical protein
MVKSEKWPDSRKFKIPGEGAGVELEIVETLVERLEGCELSVKQTQAGIRVL